MKKDVRFALFCNYINELQEIKGLRPLNLVELQNSYKSYIAASNTKWLDIFENGTAAGPIGFLIIGFPPNCHPDADYYIEEAYIKPEYRRKSHMSSFVSDFIKAYPGTYCLFILCANTVAHCFWHKVFAQLGYVPCFLKDVGAGDQYCKQYGFKKSS